MNNKFCHLRFCKLAKVQDIFKSPQYSNFMGLNNLCLCFCSKLFLTLKHYLFYFFHSFFLPCNFYFLYSSISPFLAIFLSSAAGCSFSACPNGYFYTIERISHIMILANTDLVCLEIGSVHKRHCVVEGLKGPEWIGCAQRAGIGHQQKSPIDFIFIFGEIT